MPDAGSLLESSIPEAWRTRVASILRSGDPNAIITTQQADRDWQSAFPDAWNYLRVEVPAWQNPTAGRPWLADAARATLEQVKARYLGLLTPAQIRNLRTRLGLTQKEISQLHQNGEKSWARWEAGKERPPRTMHV